MKELGFQRFSASFTVRGLISLSEPDFMKYEKELREWLASFSLSFLFLFFRLSHGSLKRLSHLGVVKFLD